jgi:AraC-like DNA-binding protein
LTGSYQEAGFAGRFHLKPGDVAVHGAFDAHLDHVALSGAEVLNLPLPPYVDLPNVFSIGDPDVIARMAEKDPFEAAMELMPSGTVTAADDWPDRLAASVGEGSEQALGSWADANGLTRETLSRGFQKVFGVAPARYRAEKKAQRALDLIIGTSFPLAAIAADCGFADQPHLTRTIVQFTGHPPGFWRRKSNPFKTRDA